MRAQWHDFSKGLWSVGGKEHTMTGYIRRAKGLHAIRTPHLRSRDGSTLLYNLTAHSLIEELMNRFDHVVLSGIIDGGDHYKEIWRHKGNSRTCQGLATGLVSVSST